MSERLRTMTDGEVVTSYRQAKNKREQLGILADLNLMTVEQVREILRAAGIGEVGEAKKTRREPPNVWRAEELDSLRRMCAEGKTAEECAEALGRTKNAVYMRAKALGLSFRRARAAVKAEKAAPAKAKKREAPKEAIGGDWRSDLTAALAAAEEIAAAKGRVPKNVLPGEDVGKKRSNKMWTTGELDSLRRMAAEGKTAEECAEALGRTKNAVYMRAKALGLSFRRARAAVKAEKAAPAKAKKREAPKEAIGGDWRSDLTAALAAAEEIAAAKGRVPKNVRILAGGEIATVEICFPGGEEYGVILRGGKEDADVQG